MRATLLLLAILISIGPGAADDADLQRIKACAMPPSEEGERLSQGGIAILESGEGGFDEAVRALERGRSALERAAACLDLSPEAETRLTDQDREFLASVRASMREGLGRLGSLREMVTSDGVVQGYLDACRKPRMADASAAYERAVMMRARRTGTEDEVQASFDASAAKLDEIDACVRSMEPYRDGLSRGARKLVDHVADLAEDLRTRIADARSR